MKSLKRDYQKLSSSSLSSQSMSSSSASYLDNKKTKSQSQANTGPTEGRKETTSMASDEKNSSPQISSKKKTKANPTTIHDSSIHSQSRIKSNVTPLGISINKTPGWEEITTYTFCFCFCFLRQYMYFHEGVEDLFLLLLFFLRKKKKKLFGVVVCCIMCREEQRQLRKDNNKRITLLKLMNERSLPSEKFCMTCWKGIPKDVRPAAWRLLLVSYMYIFFNVLYFLGYSPRNLSRREAVVANKRQRYRDLIELYYTDKNSEQRSNAENQIFHQIDLDVRRTFPSLKALYIWSHYHTATGYVQGINDLITPFVYVFLDDCHFCLAFGHQKKICGMCGEEIKACNVNKIKKIENKFGVHIDDAKSIELLSSLKEEDLLDVEADSCWCLEEFLESLQMNYTHEQPGIQRMMKKFQRLIEECDTASTCPSQASSQISEGVRLVDCLEISIYLELKLADHLKEEGVEFVQFAFRWMNCFLMREFTLQQIVNMWDTYLAEYHLNKDNVEQFHVFVCVALLLHFKKELMGKDFSEIMLFIQDLPTKNWGESQMSLLMAEAQEKRLLWSMSARVGKKELPHKKHYTNSIHFKLAVFVKFRQVSTEILSMISMVCDVIFNF
ncbi:hypothetical protein RFI_02551 [Reticulomyxa filosa]|uniref:Rab-GAP TBC domain-containing protein n=1 Tax=Reticulomyxa filosa TaxID=46433 RepID=X6PA66_RETFI|nr:hypothetical protein RFI_02551 [Reticulomyxa filosa]|eukprot:ETO34542.1 hypothetical protein RFI_02551 [Reticulomyxa filosa]